ncbi:hypothetical protein STEG23_017916 [Scotinomys teguina]
MVSDSNKAPKVTMEEPSITIQEAGTHTLCYDLTAFSQEGSRKSQFRAKGYLDNELFLHYDGERRRAESRGPRIKGQGGAEIWIRETKDMQEKEEQLRRMLSEVMTQKGQHGGIHTLQATFGCETQGNNTGGFWRLGYDGQDFFTFDQKIQRWNVSLPSAHSSRIFWERHVPSVDQIKNFLNDICPDHLQRYLIYLRNQVTDTGPPKVTVSRRPYPVGRITLTCWAFNLYPPVATLAWLQHGKLVQHHTFGPETILPSGDGTFQTWVSIWVLPGQEPEFTCQLRHCNKKIEIPTAFGSQSEDMVNECCNVHNVVSASFDKVLPMAESTANTYCLMASRVAQAMWSGRCYREMSWSSDFLTVRQYLNSPYRCLSVFQSMATRALRGQESAFSCEKVWCLKRLRHLYMNEWVIILSSSRQSPSMSFLVPARTWMGVHEQAQNDIANLGLHFGFADPGQMSRRSSIHDLCVEKVTYVLERIYAESALWRQGHPLCELQTLVIEDPLGVDSSATERQVNTTGSVL